MTVMVSPHRCPNCGASIDVTALQVDTLQRSIDEFSHREPPMATQDRTPTAWLDPTPNGEPYPDIVPHGVKERWRIEGNEEAIERYSVPLYPPPGRDAQ